MKNYCLKKKNKNKKLVKFDFQDEGFIFKPNIKNKDLIKVDCFSLKNEEMISNVLKKKIDKSFRNLVRIIISVLNDEDTTSGDVVIALNELAKEKSIIERKYKEYLKKEERDKYLKRIKAMEIELKEKITYFKTLNEERENSHSR